MGWRRNGILALCFFLSGATGLLYQVVWLRMLGLVFGHTIHAVTAVLAAFMAGLALGSFLFARRAERIRDPIRAYGLMEVGIGLYCAAIPVLFWLAARGYLGLDRALDLSYGAFAFVQFLLVFVILLVPTTLMGGTLPVLSQALVRDPGQLGRTVSALYSINTVGAVLGTVLAGYFVLPALGNMLTIAVAAAGNLLVGALALVYSRARRAPDVEAAAEAGGEDAPPGRAGVAAQLTLVALCVSGAISMLYEIAWTRALVLVVGSSTYAFTSVLVAFLVGIALGSALYGWLLGRRPASAALFGALQLGAGLSVAAVALVFERMPELFLAGLRWSESPQFVQVMQLVVSASSLLLGATFIGATFPCAVAVFARGTGHAGRDVGTVYGVNTLGAIAGSVLAGFVVVPALGVLGSIKLGIAVNLALAAVLLAVGRSDAWRWAAAAVAAAGAVATFWLPAWDQRVMSSGPAIYGPKMLRGMSGEQSLATMIRSTGNTVVYYRDGPSSTVTVLNSGGGGLSLQVNGKTDASTGADMPTQLLLGHLAMLNHPGPKRVGVIGLGSGVTAGAVARYPVEQIDIVEIEPAVVEANRFFADLNGHVLRDPRVRVRIGDGRNVLLRDRIGYDVIISEPSNPWISGLASLFTTEFFELARARLRPGGMMVQWVQLYDLPPEDLRMIVRTFRTAFPSTTIWKGSDADLLLLGRTSAAPVDLPQLRRIFETTPAAARDLGRMRITTWPGVLSYFILTEKETAAYSDGAPLNTDDGLPLEFSAPRGLFVQTAGRNSSQIRRFQQAGLPDLSPGSAALDGAPLQYAVGLAYLDRGALREAQARFDRALEIAPDHLPALVGASRAALGLEQPALALSRASAALVVDPGNVDALQVSGVALLQLYRPEEAVPLLERLVAREPTNSDYRATLAQARIRAGKR